MNKELIEKLKNNDSHRIFADMTKEEQECLRDVGGENCEVLNNYDLETQSFSWRQKGTSDFYPVYIYRIKSDYQPVKSDYQPEPEFIDLEIEEYDHMLGIWNRAKDYTLPYNYSFIHLHCIPSIPSFVGFTIDKNDIPTITLELIATLKRENKCEIYARFVK